MQVLYNFSLCQNFVLFINVNGNTASQVKEETNDDANATTHSSLQQKLKIAIQEKEFGKIKKIKYYRLATDM